MTPPRTYKDMTPDEIEALFNSLFDDMLTFEAKPGAEIIAAGLTGVWADRDMDEINAAIRDGAYPPAPPEPPIDGEDTQPIVKGGAV